MLVSLRSKVIGAVLGAMSLVSVANAMTAEEMTQAVSNADAVVVRVAKDVNGQELFNSAEIRLVNGAGQDVQALFANGVDATSFPRIQSEDNIIPGIGFGLGLGIGLGLMRPGYGPGYYGPGGYYGYGYPYGYRYPYYNYYYYPRGRYYPY